MVNCEISRINIGPEYEKSFEIKHPKNLSIGNNTAINGDFYVNALGGVSIGRFCHIAKGLTIYSHNHNWKSVSKIPYDEKLIIKPVVIGDAVWIGTNVTLAPGVILGKGVIVAAGSVVFGTLPECAIIKGNPAQVVKYRDKKIFDKLYKEEQFA